MKLLSTHLRTTTALALCVLGSVVSAQDCEALSGLTIEGAEITSAVVAPGAGGMPAYCQVNGTVDGTIGIEVRLPNQDNWNGKFNGVGNGALAGFINGASMEAAIARGYATASTDTGHVGHPVEGAPPFPGFDASWAYNAETGKRDLAALANFGHRGTHLMTVVAKQIVSEYYGTDPSYSYFTGCSGGGQQGLAEVQRYPSDYDGVLSSAPANHPMAMWQGEIYPAILARGIDIPTLAEKLPAVQAAAIAQCDALDGVEDGLIGDPTQCDFDASSVASLTEAEANVINLTYKGFMSPVDGAQVWPGFEPGSEAEWAGHLNPFFIQLGYLAYMVYEDPDWNFADFDITDPVDFAAVQEANAVLSPLMEAIDTDITAFEVEGGKLLMWHGWSDQNIAPRNTINYVSGVHEALGDDAADTVRLFMVPGMGHCQGGNGFTEFDALAALEKWVEEGVAPDTLAAVSPELGLERNLCAYPEQPVYQAGDVADAASYTCE